MDLTLLCFMISPPVIALITCIVCHRHRVLLWLGGSFVVTTGLLALLVFAAEQAQSRCVYGVTLVLVVAPPLGAAGLILLIGGLVRWGWARRRRRAPAR